jgi:hypothetical protein
MVEGADNTAQVLDWCDLALVTGTTFSNASVTSMARDRPMVFYGVTVAGPASLLGLERFCPLAS